MGNQQSTSKTVSNIVNKVVSQVLVQNSSQCAQNNSSTQSISISNIQADKGCTLDFKNISQKSVQTPNFTCSSSTDNSAALQSTLASALKQEAASQVSGLAGALNSKSTATTLTNLANDISNNINITNVSQCVQNNLASQNLEITGVKASCPSFCNDGCTPGNQCDMGRCTIRFEDISQELTQQAVANCLSSNSNVSSAISKASTELQQATVSKNEGIDLAKLADTVFKGISRVISSAFLFPALVILGVLILLGVVWAFMSPKSRDKLVDKALR